MSQSYTWVSPDGGGEGSQLVARANAVATLKNLAKGSAEYNLITELNRQLSLCMQQNAVLRQKNAEIIEKNKSLSALAAGVEGGRRKTKSKRRKSKRRKRRRRTRRRQRGRG